MPGTTLLVKGSGSSPSSTWPGDFGLHGIHLTLPLKDKPYSHTLLVALGELAAQKVLIILGLAKKGQL